MPTKEPTRPALRYHGGKAVLRKWRAYDLPHPDPVAEGLTYEEMQNFADQGFYVELMPGSMPGEPTRGGYDVQIETDRFNRARLRRLGEARKIRNRRTARRLKESRPERGLS